MINILIHGLGQNKESWEKTSIYLKNNNIETISVNLFEMMKNTFVSYENLYKAFSAFCNLQKEKVNLCGLSLGGILALDFAKEYPEKVNSIILIGTPYRIPKFLFKIQNLIFSMMLKKTFKKIGCSKKEFIALVRSMNNLNIAKDLDKIKCRSLILCGIKDKVNLKSAKLLKNKIKNSECKIISQSSHEVNIDNPQILSEVVSSFWKIKS